MIARSSWLRSLPFWPLKTNEKQVDVSWRKRFSVSVVVQTKNGFQFPARLPFSMFLGRNGFQFPSLYRRKQFFSFLRGRQITAETVFSFHCCTDRKRFSVSGEFGREQRKWFSVSERESNTAIDWGGWRDSARPSRLGHYSNPPLEPIDLKKK